MSKFYYIYKDNLPNYESYELFDPNEDDWFAATKALNNKGVRPISTLFIKGKNRVNKGNSIEVENFFNQYLKLGKKLYKLAINSGNISFTPIRELDEEEIESNYIENIELDTSFSDPQNQLINNILNIEDELYDMLDESDKLFQFIINIIDLEKLIIEKIYLLNNETDIDVTKYLSDTFKVLNEIKKIVGNKVSYLNLIEKGLEIDCIINDIDNDINNKIDINKLISISNATKKKPNKINIDNKFKKPPINVYFSYNKIKEIKKILFDWLDEFGFPYYINTDDEDEFKKYITEKFNINNNESIIPAETLIINSIYNYMLYTIFKDWKKTDEKIKKMFNFNDKKKVRNNITTIKEYNNFLSYYNNCNNIIFKFNCKNIKKDIDNKFDYSMNDNYLKNKIDEDIFEEEYVNNLCLVMNKIVENKIKDIKINDKYKKCICGKWFIPTKQNKNYCSDECSIIGRRYKNRINRRNDRKRDNKVIIE